MTGTIQMQGDQAYILTNGRSLLLPDMPADLPQDRALLFNGVVLEQPEPTMEWSTISTDLAAAVAAAVASGGRCTWKAPPTRCLRPSRLPCRLT